MEVGFKITRKYEGLDEYSINMNVKSNVGGFKDFSRFRNCRIF